MKKELHIGKIPFTTGKSVFAVEQQTASFLKTLFVIFFASHFTINLYAQPYIRTSDGYGKYGYIEKDATVTNFLVANGSYGNIYQYGVRTYVAGPDVTKYNLTDKGFCNRGDDATSNYDNSTNAISAGNILYSSVFVEYCGPTYSCGSMTPTGACFNERSFFVMDVVGKTDALVPIANYSSSNSNVVLSFTISNNNTSGQNLNRLWIINEGTAAEVTDINNAAFELYYEAATGSESFSGLESSKVLYGDYGGNATNNNIYGNDALAITIPQNTTGGLRCYVVLKGTSTYLNASAKNKSVKISIIADGISITPNRNSSFSLLKMDQTTPSSNTIDIREFSSTAINGNWNNSSTWVGNTVPADNASILIAHNVTLDKNATVSSLVINSGATFTASDGSARTLTIAKSSSGTSTTLSNSGTWANGTGGSTVVFMGAPSSGDAIHAVTGTIAFQNITVNKTGGTSNVGASFGTNSSVTGTLEIGSGGYISTAPPASFYGASAILKFNQGTGATYDVGASDYSWSTTVVPQYITISSGTVNLNADRTATGNLLIDGGTLVLKNNNATNLTIQGNWTRSSGTFTPNDGTVTLSGANSGVINATGGATVYNLVVSKTGGAKVSLGSNLTVSHDMTISNGAIFEVSAGKSLTVSGTLTNSAGNPGLVIKSDVNGTGSLKHNTDNVLATIERYVTGSSVLTQMKYHQVSIPASIASPTSNLFLGSYLYKFDETATSAVTAWVGLGGATTTPLDINKGYMIYYPNTEKTYSFAGNLRNGTVSPALTYTATGQLGYNLVPNSYPSAIDWKATAGWTKTNVDDAIYIWNSASSTANYGSYIGTTSTNGVTNIIPAGQAFFVKANAASPALSMTNSVRVHDAKLFMKSSSAVNPYELHLFAASGGVTDEIAVRFADDATSNFDSHADAYKLYGNADNPQLNSVTPDGTKLSINSLPFSTFDAVVPLEFKTGKAADVTFTATGLESFDALTPVMLEDKTAGKIIDLRQQPEYTFRYDPSNPAGRFQLRFANITGISPGEKLQGTVFLSGGKLNVNVPAINGSEAAVDIYSVSGQLLGTRRMVLNGTVQLSAPAAPGMYLVKITAGNKVYVEKFIISRTN